MNKTELNEAIEFLKVNGLNEDSYIARNVKYFMNSLNNPDDDSEELALEFREQVEIVIKAGMEVPNILSTEREIMVQRVKALLEPKAHGTGRTTIGERKGLKMALKAIKED